MPTLWNAVPIVNQFKSFMCGMKALLDAGDLARKVETDAPYASMALKTVPQLTPEYGEAAMNIDESLGSVSMGLKAVPYVANTASSIAKTVDNVLPVGKFGDLEDLVKIHRSEKKLFKQTLKQRGWR